MKNLKEKVIFPLIVSILGGVFSGIILLFISFISYGNLVHIFIEIPIYVYFFIFIILIFLYFVSYYKKGKHIKAYSITQPPYGYSKIGTLKYAKLIWIVVVPKKSDREYFYESFTMSEKNILKMT